MYKNPLVASIFYETCVYLGKIRTANLNFVKCIYCLVGTTRIAIRQSTRSKKKLQWKGNRVLYFAGSPFRAICIVSCFLFHQGAVSGNTVLLRSEWPELAISCAQQTTFRNNFWPAFLRFIGNGKCFRAESSLCYIIS